MDAHDFATPVVRYCRVFARLAKVEVLDCDHLCFIEISNAGSLAAGTIF